MTQMNLNGKEFGFIAYQDGIYKIDFHVPQNQEDNKKSSFEQINKDSWADTMGLVSWNSMLDAFNFRGLFKIDPFCKSLE